MKATPARGAVIAIFLCFSAAAIWGEFAPEREPAQATLSAAQTADIAGDEVKSCALYREALIDGNNTAAFGLADCIAADRQANSRDRAMLEYAVLLLAPDGPKRDARLASIHLKPDEMKRARGFPVRRILRGDILESLQ